jgi:hypothetical protein
VTFGGGGVRRPHRLPLAAGAPSERGRGCAGGPHNRALDRVPVTSRIGGSTGARNSRRASALWGPAVSLEGRAWIAAYLAICLVVGGSVLATSAPRRVGQGGWQRELERADAALAGFPSNLNSDSSRAIGRSDRQQATLGRDLACGALATSCVSWRACPGCRRWNGLPIPPSSLGHRTGDLGTPSDTGPTSDGACVHCCIDAGNLD